jgi:CBS domain-containing protein
MRVESIMTREVISVPADMALKDVARVLVSNRISGVPVCGPHGEVLGVVSEADILRKVEGFSPDVSGPMAWLLHHLDGELDKVEARTAAGAMTTPALTARPAQQVSEIARLMVDNRVNRLPVVAGGRLVGIVSRADLVRAFTRTDEEIEREIRDEVLLRTMLLVPGEVDIQVKSGVVTMRGGVGTQQDAEILEHCVRRVPGVLDIRAEIHCSTVPPRRRNPVVGWS